MMAVVVYRRLEINVGFLLGIIQFMGLAESNKVRIYSMNRKTSVN